MITSKIGMFNEIKFVNEYIHGLRPNFKFLLNERKWR